jgi:elongation factor 2
VNCAHDGPDNGSDSRRPMRQHCSTRGVDQYILKYGTLTTFVDAHNIADMKYSVSPVVKVSVKVKNGKVFAEASQRLQEVVKVEPPVVCTTEERGEHVIAGCGELHVGICLMDLRDEYAQ